MQYTGFTFNINIQANAYKAELPTVNSYEAPMFNKADLANAKDKEYYTKLTEKISELNKIVWSCPDWKSNPFGDSENSSLDFDMEKNRFQNMDESLRIHSNPSTIVVENVIDNVVSSPLFKQTQLPFSDEFTKSVQQPTPSNTVENPIIIAQKRQFDGPLPLSKKTFYRLVPDKILSPSPEDLSSWSSLESRIFLIYRARMDKNAGFIRVKGPKSGNNIGMSQELVLTLFNNNEGTALLRPSVVGDDHFKLSLVVSSTSAKTIESGEDVEIAPYDTCDLITGSPGAKARAKATYCIKLLGFKVNDQMQHLPTPLDIFNQTMQKVNLNFMPYKKKLSNPYKVYT